ncbi:unnamed protein product [Fusarium graminearum]|nr:unnamed protein product [Fusarium graminearum]VTO82946.1 unnamed protein product [Fusarium graminearum]
MNNSDNSSSPSRPFQTEWPIYVGQVYQKDQRRLGNLFRAIAELSEGNKESEEEDEEDTFFNITDSI